MTKNPRAPTSGRTHEPKPPTAAGPKELTRRQALLVGSGTLAGVGGITYALANPKAPTGIELIEQVVRDHLPYLTIDPEGLRQFATLYERWQERGKPGKPRKDIVERFLKSSTFFQNGADESKTVKFAAFYDPYSSPCYSPFTRD